MEAVDAPAPKGPSRHPGRRCVPGLGRHVTCLWKGGDDDDEEEEVGRLVGLRASSDRERGACVHVLDVVRLSLSVHFASQPRLPTVAAPPGDLSVATT